MMRVFCCVVICLAGLACEPAQPKVARAPQSKKAPQVKTLKKSDVVPNVVKPRSLPQWFEQALVQCKISGAGSRPRDCDRIQSTINTLLVSKGAGALAVIVPFLTDKRENMRALAIWWLTQNVPKLTLSALQKDATFVSADVVVRLIESIKQNNTTQRGGHTYVGLVVHLGLLTNQRPKVVNMIESLKDHRVKANAIAALMQYGRMSVFEDIQPYTKSNESIIKHAALITPMRMASWTASERKVLCPWYAKFVKDMTTDAVAHGLVACGDKSIDTLLDETQRRIKMGQFTGAFSLKVRDVCVKKGKTIQTPMRKKQCVRLHKLLAGAVINPRMSDADRKQSMASMVLIQPNKVTLSQLSVWSKDKNALIANEAVRQIRLLKTIQILKSRDTK